ncbi:MAG: hypothetical protein ACOYVK_04245 [Bacillota bacterium]
MDKPTHEIEYPSKDISWISNKEQQTWAKGRLCELNANINEDTGKYEFTVISHNELNCELDSRYKKQILNMNNNALR